MEAWLQQGYGVRFDWGPEGARRLAPGSAYAVVVDVLSFTTSVSVLVDAGTRVHPRAWHEAPPASDGGIPVATGRRSTTPERPWSLSPAALRRAPRTPDLILPSPNGSAIAAAIQDHCGLVAGSLRNAAAVGRWLRAAGVGTPERPLTVIAAGERWPDGSLRPAMEDLLGAGAVIAALRTGSPSPRGTADLAARATADLTTLSPEADLAARAYRATADPRQAIMDSASGRELAAIGFADDVAVAVEIGASDTVPILRDGAFSAAGPGSGAG
ncbi:2-phosphosulfolactate phosphatase [Asanoa sp. WMMD1127]|uniref:2-phosphosulfolactate phosphatase n=1 Tax=Asanoa sp. WMMD1127 TaxID=3016107 RepID=UPI0024178920|nr:2-phosphosulfolactate phosphatase [Asanoa sp. WMMD1127]MDG4824114.1 2-phosphosulfolactate phosphatase [Asanoa sp. WMMD1127]